jgi:hypothetical protein
MPQKTRALSVADDPMVAIDPSSLQRFAATVPQLQRLLQASDGCNGELLLRAAMRDALRELAEVSTRAARVEADPLRAEQLRVVSKVATELALTAPH